jgi:hypothetical protein
VSIIAIGTDIKFTKKTDATILFRLEENLSALSLEKIKLVSTIIAILSDGMIKATINISGLFIPSGYITTGFA